MTDSLFALKVFARVARTGSFSRAGRELGAPQPSVSRVIAALERKLGVALFTRTTRAVVLTEAGASYLAHVERVLVASPAYLKRAGTPKTPEDLADHAIIVGPPGAGPGGWSFERDGRRLSVKPEPHLAANVNEAATAAAVAGLGILSTG